MLLRGCAEKDAVANKLYPIATDFRVLIALFCLKDILEDIDILSKTLQTKGISVYECKTAREACMENLLGITDPPQIMEDPADYRNFSFPSFDLFLKESGLDKCDKAYKGEYAVTNYQDRSNLQQILIRSGVFAFRDTVVSSLRSRWDTDEDRLVELFAVFDPKGMDGTHGPSGYGKDQIQQLGNFFHYNTEGDDWKEDYQLHGPIKIDADRLVFEWGNGFLKSTEHKRLKTRDDALPKFYSTAEDFWRRFFFAEEGTGYKKEDNEYKNLYLCVSAALVIMNSNAEAERVFSVQTDTIVPKRSRLGVERLKQGTHVTMGCRSDALPLVNFTRRAFDYNRLYGDWAKARRRRPGGMGKVPEVWYL